MRSGQEFETSLANMVKPISIKKKKERETGRGGEQREGGRKTQKALNSLAGCGVECLSYSGGLR